MHEPVTREAPAIAPRGCSRAFPAAPAQVREARTLLRTILHGSPVADDAILCVSELASNSVLHSDSRKPGGTFTVRVEVHEGDYAHVEVEDNGGPWRAHPCHDARSHGLDIVRELADDFGIDGDALTGWIVWARLDWPAPTTSLHPARIRHVPAGQQPQPLSPHDRERP